MPYQIFLSDTARSTIHQEAQNAFPNECCGFLLGTTRGRSRLIDHALPVANSKEGDQRRRFEISPTDYLHAEQYAIASGKQLLGIYHSHPNHPAIPSEYDLAQALPFFSYLIVSVMEGRVEHWQSWRLCESRHEFLEEELGLFQAASIQ